MKLILIVKKVIIFQHRQVLISNYQNIFRKLMEMVVNLEKMLNNLHYLIYYLLIFEYFYDHLTVKYEVYVLIVPPFSCLIDHPRILYFK